MMAFGSGGLDMAMVEQKLKEAGKKKGRPCTVPVLSASARGEPVRRRVGPVAGERDRVSVSCPMGQV